MHPFSTSPFHQLASPTGLGCFLMYSQNAKNVQWLHMDLELKNIILAHVKQPTMWKPYVITCFVKGLSAGGRTLDLMQLFHLSGSHIKNFKGWKSFKKWINNFICIAEPGIHHLFSTCPSCFFFLLTISPPPHFLASFSIPILSLFSPFPSFNLLPAGSSLVLNFWERPNDAEMLCRISMMLCESRKEAHTLIQKHKHRHTYKMHTQAQLQSNNCKCPPDAPIHMSGASSDKNVNSVSHWEKEEKVIW